MDLYLFEFPSTFFSPDKALTFFQRYAFPLKMFSLALIALFLLYQLVQHKIDRLNHVFPAILFGSVCLFLLTLTFFFNLVLDDAYVHYRIVENLIAGKGYVYNIGERSEGTATPLWHFILLVSHLLTKCPLPLLGRLLGIAATLAVLVITQKILRYFFLSKTTVQWTSLSLVTLPAIFLYASSGMETNVFLAGSLATYYFFLQKRYLLSGVISGLLVWLRPEGIILGTLLGILLLLRRVTLDRKCWNTLMMYFVPLFVATFSIALFRYKYFGTFIPHVVKMKSCSPFAIPIGLNYFFINVQQNIGLVIFFIMGGILFIRNYVYFRRLRCIRGLWVIVAYIGVQLLVVVVGGGDWMPSARFFNVALVFALIFIAVIYERLSTHFAPDTTASPRRKQGLGALIPIGFLLIVTSQLFLTKVTPLEPFSVYKFKRSQLRWARDLYSNSITLSIMGKFINKVFAKDAIIYTRWIGYLPYFSQGRKIVDELSYFNDTIFRRPSLGVFTKKPGHLFEGHGLIIKEKPDIVTNVGNSPGNILYLYSKEHIEKGEGFYWDSKVRENVKKYMRQNYALGYFYFTGQRTNGARGFVLFFHKEMIPMIRKKAVQSMHRKVSL